MASNDVDCKKVNNLLMNNTFVSSLLTAAVSPSHCYDNIETNGCALDANFIMPPGVGPSEHMSSEGLRIVSDTLENSLFVLIT